MGLLFFLIILNVVIAYTYFWITLYKQRVLNTQLYHLYGWFFISFFVHLLVFVLIIKNTFKGRKVKKILPPPRYKVKISPKCP